MTAGAGAGWTYGAGSGVTIASAPGAGQAGFAPPSANLAHQYVSGAGVTVAGAGASVWADQVGSEDLTQADDGARPEPVISIGQNAMYLTQSEYFDIPATLAVDYRDCSIFVCYRPTLDKPPAPFNQTLVHLKNSDPAPFLMYASATEDLAGKCAVFNGGSRVSDISWGVDAIQVMAVSCDASNVTVYHGRESEALVASGAQTSNQTGRVGAAIGSVEPYEGYIYEILFYDAALNATEVAAVQDYLTGRWGALSRDETVFLCVEGDSHTHGSNGAGGQENWLRYMAELLPSAPKVFNDAVGGERLDEMAVQTTHAAELALNAAYTRVAILYGGTNDGLASRSHAAIVADLDTIVAAMKNDDGADSVYVCTIFACGPITGADEVIRLSVNEYIRNTLAADGVIDFAADARLQNSSDTTYYLGDTVHLTDTGSQVAAGIARAALVADGVF